MTIVKMISVFPSLSGQVTSDLLLCFNLYHKEPGVPLQNDKAQGGNRSPDDVTGVREVYRGGRYVQVRVGEERRSVGHF